jgi:hypothetical protein
MASQRIKLLTWAAEVGGEYIYAPEEFMGRIERAAIKAGFLVEIMPPRGTGTVRTRLTDAGRDAIVKATRQ